MKTIALLRWTALNCPLVKFMLKLDSDTYLRPELFLSQINLLSPNAIYGQFRSFKAPHRQIFSKWYINQQNYPHHLYPPICVSIYFIPGKLTLKLYQSIIKKPQIVTIPALPLEDNYLGILAEKANIPRKQFKGLRRATSKDINFTALKNSTHSIFSEKLLEKDIKQFWNVFKQVDYPDQQL